jgi:diguanylate cyclase (GGDEF)-like protein
MLRQSPETAPAVIRKGVPDKLLKLFPYIGFLLGVVMWCIDAAIDVYVINPDEEFVESMLEAEGTELWMRTLVLIVMTVSAIFAQVLLRRQKFVELELRHHKDNLEQLVRERTRELEQIANTDELTQIYNRRKFLEILEYEIQRNLRYQQSMSLLLCDIDHFKQINDNFGHDLGDSVLANFANCMRANLRKSDVYARWGGEEFILLLPHTPVGEAKIVAQKLCDMIPACSGSDKIRLTASFGVAQLQNGESDDSLIQRADQALYKAKHNGRNCVAVAG